MVNDIDKKSLQNSNFITKNNNLEKSYDSTNNQIMIFQSKVLFNLYLVRIDFTRNEVHY
jgi:hypothetical protein